MQLKKQIQDLIEDGSFTNYVFGTNESDTRKWEKWLEKNSHYQELVEEARQMVLGLPFQKQSIPPKNIDQGLDRLMATLDEPKSRKLSTGLITFGWLKAAAAIALLLVGIWGLNHFFSTPELMAYQTMDGETKRIFFPDGSEILLNANSKLSYYSDLTYGTLSLEGEAYFQIKKQKKGNPLQIKTNDLTVSVIGTQFNLNSRRGETVVSLNEGLVQLHAAQDQNVNLEAGEIAWFDKGAKKFVIKEGKTGFWGTWKDKEWVFEEGTSFREVLLRMEETFGLEPEVLDSALLDRKISGGLGIESKAVLLQSMEAVYDIHIIEKNAKQIIIQAHQEE